VSTANAWIRWYWLWDVLFGITFAATAVLVFVEASRAAAIVAVVAVAGIAAAYLVAHHGLRFGDDTDRARWIFAGAILGCLTVAVFAAPSTGFVLFAVCPMLFMALPPPTASAFTAAAILLPLVSTALNSGVHSGIFATMAPMTGILIVFGVCTGVWLDRIVEQSKERAELIEQLERSRAEVGKLSHEAGTAAERARLATEIHDTLAQGFTSIVALTQAVESELDTDPATARRHLDLAARTARENLAEARAMVAALGPSALAGGSLDEAIRRRADRLAEESAVPVRCEVTGPLPPLGTAVEVVLLRAAQEALTNVGKHANASSVRVRLSVVDDLVRLSVVDDGIGFDPEAPATGFGLRGMESRAAQIGGKLTVHSGPDAGTAVELEVPAG
jgi:signal transduction histidine kinase